MMKARLYGTEKKFEIIASARPMPNYLMDAPEGIMQGQEALIEFEDYQDLDGETKRRAKINQLKLAELESERAQLKSAMRQAKENSAALKQRLVDACGNVSSLSASDKNQLLEDILQHLVDGHG